MKDIKVKLQSIWSIMIYFTSFLLIKLFRWAFILKISSSDRLILKSNFVSQYKISSTLKHKNFYALKLLNYSNFHAPHKYSNEELERHLVYDRRKNLCHSIWNIRKILKSTEETYKKTEIIFILLHHIHPNNCYVPPQKIMKKRTKKWGKKITLLSNICCLCLFFLFSFSFLGRYKYWVR